jgi:hypothetical protein
MNESVVSISRDDSINSYRSYQKLIYCTPSFKIQYPKNLSELIDLVRQEGIVKGYKIKPIGQLHSITDIICTSGIPISLKNINHAKINDGGLTASFGAGIELEDALIYLENRNYTLIHVTAFGW